MKTPCLLALLAALSTHLLAQPAAPVSTAPAESTVLSNATLDHIGKMTPLFDGKTLDGWLCFTNDAWTVKDGAISSLGAGRSVLCTKGEYGNYRLIFKIRHVAPLSGKSDHQPCFLIFCVMPPDGQKGLDALGGIQFQPPNGGSWDYRPGHNNNGKDFFKKLPHPKFDNHEWSQVEILVNAKNGTARMAVAQPVGTKAVEVLDFNDPTAGRKGPIALQMHNKGLFDEYKDIRIEENPATDQLITVEP